MRALFTHPLHRVALVSLAFSVLLVAPTLSQTVPRSIGPLSDYGNVFDRHGRDEALARIDRIRDATGISAYVLASWENPFTGIDPFVSAVFNAWGLDRGRTILLVLVKDDRDWEARVLASDATIAVAGPLEGDLQAAIADLVDHRRIAEAITAFFDRLDERLGLAAGPATASEPSGVSLLSMPPAVSVPLVLIGLALLAWGVHRRVCPRCGRLLRVAARRDPMASGPGAHRVYFCRRCGFRREKR